MSQLYYVLLTVLGIGFLIFFHELGHYICARLAGVRVLVFSLGFGPRLFGFVRGGTDYRIAAVPLGGYVRVAGEDPTQRDDMETDGLHSKGIGARALFFAGGVAMNLLFAFIAFPIAFHWGVEFNAPVIGAVVPGSPAWQAGLEPGDRIVSVDGKETYSFENTAVEIALAGDRPVDLLLQRDGREFDREVRPRYDADSGMFTIGIEAAMEPTIDLQVQPGSPADKAGLRTGDTLLSLNGEPVTVDDFATQQSALLYEQQPVDVTVERDGSRHTAHYTPEWTPLPDPVLGVVPAARRVVGVRPGGPVIGRLLHEGDQVIEVDGVRFRGETLEPFTTGPDQLTMTVLRPDSEQPTVVSAKVTPQERAALADAVGFGFDRRGSAVAPMPGSPAAVAGLQSGDEIVAINQRRIESWDELKAAVDQFGREPLQVTLQGSEGTRQVTVQPAQRQIDFGFVARLSPRTDIYRKGTVAGAMKAGVVASIDLIKSLYVTLKRLFTGEVAAKNLGGIITISRVTYSFAQSGWERFLYFLAMLSINLAFINVLPIPVLDGGHLMFVAIEAVKGSPVNPKVFNYSQVIGLVFIVALLVFVTYNDILRLL